MTASRGTRLRRRLLVTAVIAMAGALVVAAGSNYAIVLGAQERLRRGQGEVLVETVRRRLAESPGPPRDHDLEHVLRAEEAAGLRYVAVRGRGGELVAEAGESRPFARDRVRIEAGPPRAGGPEGADDPGPPGADRPPAPEDGARQRDPALDRDDSPAPPPRPRWAPRDGADGRPAPPPPRGPRPRPFQPPRVVVEFEPLLARDLGRRALLTLAAGIGAAGLLTVSLLLMLRDVLAREALEREVERARSLRNLGEMSAVLAHEIRNPLAALKGHAQLLGEMLPEGGPERAKSALVVEEALRIERLTADLLDFVRAGRVERQATDPGAVLEGAARSLADARIAVSSTGAPARFSLDGERMRQVLVNPQNALQASNDASPVEASVCAEQGRLVFRVRDHGPGFAPESFDRIFEPFFTRRLHGTGLGLAIASRIVEQHGGTLAARNHPDGGAELEVSIPAG